MIILMGSAGSGKSVQGKMLVDSLGYSWLSTGAILRQQLDNPEHKEQIERGDLLDDETVEQLVGKTIEQLEDPKKVILDGFPRNHHQAQWLVGFCRNSHVSIEAVIHINLSLEVARQRLFQRGRADDHTEAIDRRFHEYENTTVPILKYFDEQEIEVLEINGGQTIDEVHEEIVEAIKSVHQG